MSASLRKFNSELLTSFRPGDILAFSGGSWLSDFINVATLGIPRYSTSHVGILGEWQHEVLLFESTMQNTAPCRIQGKEIRGSQAQRLGPRLSRYKGRVWHYPLYRPLYDHENRRLSKFLEAGLGKSYDEIGAFRSGGLAFSWFESKLRPPNMEALFCSEWVAAALSEIGIMPSKWSPNRLIRHCRKIGILQKPRRLC